MTTAPQRNRPSLQIDATNVPQVSGPRTPVSTGSVRSSASSASPANAPQRAQSAGGGQRIGPYALGKTLGVGSTGRVKLGTHIETGHRVAIKIIPKESLGAPQVSHHTRDQSSSSSQPTGASPQSQSRTGSPAPPSPLNKKLEREITIMKLIQHPNVLQLYDVYETDKELFLILEHVEGGELFDYLVKKGRLTESEGLQFFQQIMFGIDFCHRHLICHRDLKPENLLLDRDLNVKIADFGMASLQVTGKMLETSCGSPHYASPEIIKGVKYDGAPADIWSCGVILYALLTGNLPFDDENIRRLLGKVKSGMYFIPDHVSPEAKDLIKKMLVVDPARRITMKEIFRHPWFRSQQPKNGESNYPAPVDTVKMTHPIDDPNAIDPDIIQSLGLLGWGNEDELIGALMSSEPNMEKVFYNLLYQRKWEFFEHYDIRSLNEWDVEGGPRRRADSYSNLLSDRGSSRFDLFRSEVSLSPLIDKPSHGQHRKSIDELRQRSTDELASSSSKTKDVSRSVDELRGDGEDRRERRTGGDRRKSVDELGSKPTVEEGVQRRKTVSPGPVSSANRIAAVTNSAVRVSSPLSTSTTFFDENEMAQAQGTASPLPPLPTFDHMRARSASSNSTTSSKRAPSPSPVSLREDPKRKLTINIPAAGGEQVPAQVSAGSSVSASSGDGETPGRAKSQNDLLAAGGLGTPKFHRKKAEVPPTPVITSSPKRSWFANLFHFKPEVFTLLSTRGVEETLAYVEQQLLANEVKLQPRKEGGFRCKFDSQNSSAPSQTSMSDSPVGSVLSDSPETSSPTLPNSTSGQGFKSTKFKVDVVPDEEGCRISFVQQQGSFTTFQMVVDRIKSRWEIGK
ncbi:hypothetical protein HK097_000643 [Rhizophlyctis rosea]|uniref:non-specific serine/threonine protein kinase n=1 Tax=Rhizophlyctis rosea TaxID=64517 RepID=A0AAD5X1V9_9FUNG|nr:hypothetical protein HK097_000643 [Rhizophlyctis rosea]